jgi:transcriptional regulator of acetoin/glycerol metabolism
MRALVGYDWPGNVRELENAIEYSVVHASQPVIQCEDLPPEMHLPSAPGVQELVVAGLNEKEQLLAALEQAKGNRTVAAQLLGISRATLYRRLSSLDIQPS